MRVTAESSGQGELTVGELAEALQGFPDDAVVKIVTGSDQKDGAFWNLKVSWESTSGPGILNLRGPEQVVGRVEVPILTDDSLTIKGVIEDTKRANDWLNPYKGQWGDH